MEALGELALLGGWLCASLGTAASSILHLSFVRKPTLNWMKWQEERKCQIGKDERSQ